MENGEFEHGHRWRAWLFDSHAGEPFALTLRKRAGESFFIKNSRCSANEMA